MTIATSFSTLTKGVVDGKVAFAVGDLYGPCKCESGECTSDAWFIWMTVQEYEEAKTKSSPTTHVFQNKIGTALCKQHEPTSE